MSIDFGRATTVVRSPKEGWSARIDVRTVTVCLVLVALALAIGVIALGSGDYQVPIGDVLGALFGEAPARIHMVVVEWRLPRVLLALMLGAALGMSGAIFQSLTRNPLGSPDIIGFNSGAYTGALVVILLIGGTYYEIAVGALVGGIATAAVVYLLAYKRGVQGFRLIIVGIAISAMLGSVNTWMILKAKLDDAMAAAVWGAGSLNGLGWTQVWPVVVVLAILVPLILVFGQADADARDGRRRRQGAGRPGRTHAAFPGCSRRRPDGHGDSSGRSHRVRLSCGSAVGEAIDRKCRSDPAAVGSNGWRVADGQRLGGAASFRADTVAGRRRHRLHRWHLFRMASRARGT